MVRPTMILRFSSWQSGSTLGVLALSLIFICTSNGQEKRSGRPIEFSDPKGADASTNVSPLSTKRSMLRELEDDLTKSFQKSLSSHSSLDGVAMPPPAQMPGSVIQSKKVKELLDRKKNWYLNSPEDLTSTPTAQELLHLPDYATDPEGKKPRSSL